jgi:hypothetical protein
MLVGYKKMLFFKKTNYHYWYFDGKQFLLPADINYNQLISELKTNDIIYGWFY